MININNKSWDKLRFSDVEKFLMNSNDESFFFEFKSDKESPSKLIKEVSAFANTYGGYIFLGIDDDKTISGCTQWTEQRIHVSIHDSITPIPNFAVRKLKRGDKTIFIIKVEEGTMPPYVTGKGEIYERVSSGSFPIKDSYKLNQLYNKRVDNLKRIHNKIEFKEAEMNNNLPNNLFGYLDLGFSVTCSEKTELEKNFYNFNLESISKQISSLCSDFSISRIGYSYIFTVGGITAKDNQGNIIHMQEGLHNILEIMADGSVKCRILLLGSEDNNRVDITPIGYYMYAIFRKIYSMIFGDKFYKIFVHAHKYNKLTVVKQFIPYYKLSPNDTKEDIMVFSNYLQKHQNK